MKSQKSNQPVKAHVMFNMRSKSWMVSVGLVHGISQKTPLTIYDEKNNQVAQGQLTQIMPEKSQIEITAGILDSKREYVTLISDFVDNSLKIFLKGKDVEFRALNETIDEAFDRFLLQCVEVAAEADYVISIEKKCYRISLPDDNRPLVLPLPISAPYTLDTLRRILWDISKWNYVKKLNNSSSKIQRDDVAIQIYKIEEDANPEKDRLLTPNAGKISLHKKDRVRIAIQNNNSQRSFLCGLLGLSADFGISTDFLEGILVDLQPNQQEYIWEGDAIYLEDIFMEHFTKDNWKEVELHFKLVISTERFDPYVFESPGVPMPYGDLEHYNLMRIIRRRTFFSPKEWQENSVTLVLENPDYNESKKGFSSLFSRFLKKE